MYEDKKIENWNNEYIAQFIDTMHCRVSPLSYTIVKLFCLKPGAYSFAKFVYCNWKNIWLGPFLQVKVSVVNSACGSFCWNYATGTCYSN